MIDHERASAILLDSAVKTDREEIGMIVWSHDVEMNESAGGYGCY